MKLNLKEEAFTMKHSGKKKAGEMKRLDSE